MPVVKGELKTVLEWSTSRIYLRKSIINHSILKVFYAGVVIPSATPVFNLLQKMKKQNIHLAIVMDEFNSVAGW